MTYLLNEIFPKIYLINLDRRTDRLEQFNNQAQQLNIKYERLSATEMDDPIAACKESHIRALTQCDSPVVFVFEDDSAFIDNFYEELQKSLEVLPDDWDMVYLGANLVDTKPINDRWHKSQRCCSTHAYAVKREVVPRLVESARNYDGHVDMAFSLCHPKLNVYLARPTLVYQKPGKSDILGKVVDYKRLYF